MWTVESNSQYENSVHNTTTNKTTVFSIIQWLTGYLGIVTNDVIRFPVSIWVTFELSDSLYHVWRLKHTNLNVSNHLTVFTRQVIGDCTGCLKKNGTRHLLHLLPYFSGSIKSSEKLLMFQETRGQYGCFEYNRFSEV